MKLLHGTLTAYCFNQSGANCQNHDWLTMYVSASAGEMAINTLATNSVRTLENFPPNFFVICLVLKRCWNIAQLRFFGKPFYPGASGISFGSTFARPLDNLPR